MALDTNFNISPYFDDFDEDKKFYRIVFRAGRPVQARELTQLQTILQSQIERFGNAIYQNGTIIKGCEINYTNNFDIVRIKDTFAANSANVDVTTLVGSVLVSNTTGLKAQIITVKAGTTLAYPDTNRLYVRYLNSGNNGGTQVQTFSNNENLSVFTQPLSSNTFSNSTLTQAGGLAITTYANTAANTVTVDQGAAVSVGEGIIYQKGFFIKVDPIVCVVSDNNAFAAIGNCSVGFVTDETIVNSDNDTSLLDNALGYSNYTAPGADRLKLTANLVTLDANAAASNSNFTPIMTFNFGIPIIKEQDPEYSRIGDEMARRSYETNGSFVIKPFKVDTKTHATNTSLYQLEVSPGLGYAQGYRVELLNAAKLDVRRGLDTANGLSTLVTTSYGQYVYVKEYVGTFDFTGVESIDIYDTVKQSITNRTYALGSPSGSKVGTANMRTISYVSGTPGTPTAVYAIYLFNIKMNSGKSFANDAKAFYFNGSTKGFADIVPNAGYANTSYINSSERRRMIWAFGKKAIKTATSNAQYYFRQKSTGTLAVDGRISITIPSAHSGGTDRIAASTGVEGDTLEQRTMVVITSNTATANLTGTVSVSTSSNVITGSGTSFTTIYSVGEFIYLNSFDVRRIVAISNNTSLQIDANSTFTNATSTHAKFYPIGYTVPLTDTMVGTRTINVTSNTTFTANIGSAVTGQNLTSTATATLYYDILRSVSTPSKKTIVKNVYVKIDTANNAANNVGPWNLGFTDVHRIRNVYAGTTYSNTNPDILTSTLYWDSGQKDTHYDGAKLYLRPGLSIAANTKLFVCLDYFVPNTTSGVGFFNIDSYPIDDANTANTSAIQTSDIPAYVAENGDFYALRDCIDFRNHMTITANSVANGDPANTQITINPVAPNTFTVDAAGVNVPTPDQNLQADIQYYLGRKDVLFFATTGTLRTYEGAPSEKPLQPPLPQDGMPVAYINVPPYPSTTSSEQAPITLINRTVKNLVRDASYQIQSDLLTYRRYTMRDIGVLDSRISNLEYYMSLSLLEKAATDMQIVSSTTGLNRFKNGIFVDSFTSHINGDVTNPEYKVAIDTDKGYARPYFTQEQVYLNPNTLTNTTQTGRVITLPYTHISLINQQKASKYRNAAPVAWSWLGAAQLYPNYDGNVDKTALASVNVTIDEAQAWQDFANSPWGTQYGQWRTTGVNTNSSTNRTTSTDRSGTTVTSTTTTTTNTTQQRTDQKLNIDTTTTTYNLGQYVTDVRITPFIVAQEIGFVARNLRPNTRVYAFFDSVNVSNNCAMGTINNSIVDTSDSRYVTRTQAYGSNLVTDSTGFIAGKFSVPAGTFRQGDRTFQLCDVDNLVTGANAITTSCSTRFTSDHLSATTQGITLTTIEPEISVKTSTETLVTTTRAVQTSTQFTPATPPPTTPRPRPDPCCPVDPVAQGIRIILPDGVSGTYLTKIDLYFKKKSYDSTHGIQVYICEMLNGYPNTNRILPFSRSWLPASSVNVSDTGTVATTFTFESPVYVADETDYAFIVKPDGSDPDYLLWCAELGQFDVSTGAQIFSMPYMRNMFLSATETTWTSLPTEYIKFNMYRSSFTTLTGNASFTNNPEDLLVINNLTYSNGAIILQSGDYIFKAINASPGAVNTSVWGVVDHYDTGSNTIYVTPTTGNWTAANTLIQLHRISNTANITANSTTYFGYANIGAISNILSDAVVPRFATLSPAGTTLAFYYKGTSNTYVKDSTYQQLVPETETELYDMERIVPSRTNEVNNMSANSSTEINIKLTSENEYISPLIDMVRSNLLVIGNQIDATTANVFLEYQNIGAMKSKYLSVPVVLAANNDAEDLKVIVTAYRPVTTDVKVYCKLLSAADGDSITDKYWTLMTCENSTVYSDYRDTTNFVELSYVMPTAVPDGSTVLDFQSNPIPTQTAYLGANNVIYKDATGATHNLFKTFQIKIVFQADSSARVPILADCRAIALQL